MGGLPSCKPWQHKPSFVAPFSCRLRLRSWKSRFRLTTLVTPQPTIIMSHLPSLMGAKFVYQDRSPFVIGPSVNLQHPLMLVS